MMDAIRASRMGLSLEDALRPPAEDNQLVRA
jgi:hypothetical protein